MVFSFLTEFIQLLSSDTIYLCSWSGDMYLKEYIELLYHPSIGRVRGKKNQQSQTKQVHVSLYVLFSTRNFLIILREGSNKQILKYQSFFFFSKLFKEDKHVTNIFVYSFTHKENSPFILPKQSAESKVLWRFFFLLGKQNIFMTYYINNTFFPLNVNKLKQPLVLRIPNLIFASTLVSCG